MFNNFINNALEKGVSVEDAKKFISQYYDDEKELIIVPKDYKQIIFYLFNETIYHSENYILYDKTKCKLKVLKNEKVFIHFDFESYMKFNDILSKEVMCYKFKIYFDEEPNIINNIVDTQRGVLINIANTPF